MHLFPHIKSAVVHSQIVVNQTILLNFLYYLRNYVTLNKLKWVDAQIFKSEIIGDIIPYWQNYYKPITILEIQCLMVCFLFKLLI